MNRTMQKLACTAAIVVAASIAACSPPTIDVSGDWKQAIRNYGLLPLYPMQEDVKVGDVFLYIQPTAEQLGVVSAERRNNESSWLIRVDGLSSKVLMGDASSRGLQSVYADRLRLQPEPQQPAGANQPAAAKQPAAVPAAANAAQQPKKSAAGQAAQVPAFDVYNPTAVDKNGQPQPVRLQRIALPGLQVARVTNGQLTAAAPIQTFLAKFGLSASDATGYDLTLSDVEEVHLPIAPAYKLLQLEVAEFLANILSPEVLLFWVHQRNPDLLTPLCATRFDDRRLKNSLLLIANEVVYAHAVDYSFASNSTLAGQIAVSLAAASTQPGGGAPNGGAGAGAPANGSGPTASTETALGAAIKSLNDSTNSQSAAGGSASFGIGRTGNLTLKQSFDMPMAIGMGSFIEYSLGELMEQYQWIYLPTSNRILSSQNELARFRSSAEEVVNYYCQASSPLLSYLKGEARPAAGPVAVHYVAGMPLN